MPVRTLSVVGKGAGYGIDFWSTCSLETRRGIGGSVVFDVTDEK